MSSLIYDSFLYDQYVGNVKPDVDTLHAILVTSSYTPNKATHTKRSDITNEITGTGYSAGGAVITASVALDTTNNRLEFTLGGYTWTAATITARGVVVCKWRGGAASADELICYGDFGSDIIVISGSFPLLFPSTLRFQN